MRIKKNIIIVGAGGFGREVYIWLKQTLKSNEEYEFKGFLAEEKSGLEVIDGFSIIGSAATYVPNLNDVFIMGIGNPLIKESVATILKKKSAVFITLIHPTAIVGPDTLIKEGCVICPYAVVTSDVKIGQFVTLNVSASIGHDVFIGDYSTLSPHVDVTGGCKLGKRVFIGSHATIIPRVIVEDDAKIGAGSAVIQRVQSGQTVMGVPAKLIYSKSISPKDGS